jgi:hypothetical protein
VLTGVDNSGQAILSDDRRCRSSLECRRSQAAHRVQLFSRHHGTLPEPDYTVR